jgi:hypothetical protein
MTLKEFYVIEALIDLNKYNTPETNADLSYDPVSKECTVLFCKKSVSTQLAKTLKSRIFLGEEIRKYTSTSLNEVEHNLPLILKPFEK